MKEENSILKKMLRCIQLYKYRSGIAEKQKNGTGEKKKSRKIENQNKEKQKIKKI